MAAVSDARDEEEEEEEETRGREMSFWFHQCAAQAACQLQMRFVRRIPINGLEFGV